MIDAARRLKRAVLGYFRCKAGTVTGKEDGGKEPEFFRPNDYY